MKRILALVLALALMLAYAGCEAAEEHGSRKRKNKETEETASAEAASTSPISAQEYYRYIKEEMLSDGIIPDKLAELGTHVLKDCYDSTLTLDESGTGLLSALVDDFDGDGCLELLAIHLNNINIDKTIWRYARYNPGEASAYDLDDRELVLSVQLLDYEGGTITSSDLCDMNFVQTANWYGSMYVGIEKTEDAYYVFSGSNIEEASYGGSRIFTVLRIDEEGICFKYHNPIYFGKITPANTNDRVGVDNPLEPDEYSFNEYMRSYETQEDAEEAMGQRLLCYVNYGWDDDHEYYNHTNFDYTNLLELLEKDGANWKARTLPEGFKTERTQADYVTYVETLAREIEAKAGVTFSSSDWWEQDDRYGVSCMTDDNTTLTITYSISEKAVTYISVYNKNKTDNWSALKDAVLDHSVLGLSQEQAQPFKGIDVNLSKYMSGIEVGEWIIAVGAVQDVYFDVKAKS